MKQAGRRMVALNPSVSGRPQDGRAESQRFRHALCAELYSKVRHVYGLISIKHRQVNDPVNTGLPGYI